MVNYLGLDIGRRRIGLSTGSDELMLALPLRAVMAIGGVCFAEIAEIIRELGVNVVVVGYPFNMDGTASDMSEYVNEFVAKLKNLVGAGVKFIMFDERLTSSQAESDLRAARAGKFESRMRKKKLRVAGAVDSNAAAIILQDYLNELTLRP